MERFRDLNATRARNANVPSSLGLSLFLSFSGRAVALLLQTRLRSQPSGCLAIQSHFAYPRRGARTFPLSRAAREFSNNARAASRCFAANLTRKRLAASSACLRSEPTPRAVYQSSRFSAPRQPSRRVSRVLFSRDIKAPPANGVAATSIIAAMTNHVACRVKC